VSPRTARIAELNDLLRETFLTGQVVLTEGISNLPDDVREAVLTNVRAFSAFNEDNDPYGEHDFGAIDIAGAGKVFWKIDAYDRDYRYHSPDPADPKVTCRVLTIMLAEEY
jgi:hypothetical protein